MKKIMFNDRYGLTQAVLDGRKTQTRRVAKIKDIVPDITRYPRTYPRAHYKVGEEVAVAQKYDDVWDFVKSKGKDDDLMLCANLCVGATNKLYVKAGLMPHRIRITNVRVERLQDISDEDCLKEGIHVDDNVPEGVPLCKYIAYSYDADPSHQKKKWWYDTPRKAFAALIDLTCGRGTWASNPWVFVYEFELA